MKAKIVLLPLDERPCNYLFPGKLFSHDEIEIVTPDKMGEKKTSADLTYIDKFLTDECIDAPALLFLWICCCMEVLFHQGFTMRMRKN